MSPSMGPCFSSKAAIASRTNARMMTRYTDAQPRTRELWSYPVCMYTYFHRCLELASRELRLPEEGTV